MLCYSCVGVVGLTGVVVECSIFLIPDFGLFLHLFSKVAQPLQRPVDIGVFHFLRGTGNQRVDEFLTGAGVANVIADFKARTSPDQVEPVDALVDDEPHSGVKLLNLSVRSSPSRGRSISAINLAVATFCGLRLV